MKTAEQLESQIKLLIQRESPERVYRLLGAVLETNPELISRMLDLLISNRINLADFEKQTSMNTGKIPNVLYEMTPREFVDMITTQKRTFISKLTRGELLLEDIQNQLRTRGIQETFDESSNSDAVIVDTRRYKRGFYKHVVNDEDDALLSKRYASSSNFIENLVVSGYPERIKTINPFSEIPIPRNAFSFHDGFSQDTKWALDAVTSQRHNSWEGAQEIISTSNGEPFRSFSNFTFTPKLDLRTQETYTIAIAVRLEDLSSFVPVPSVTSSYEIVRVDSESPLPYTYHTTRKDVKRVHKTLESDFIIVYVELIQNSIQNISIAPRGVDYQDTILEQALGSASLPIRFNDFMTRGGDGSIELGGLFVWKGLLDQDQKQKFTHWMIDIALQREHEMNPIEIYDSFVVFDNNTMMFSNGTAMDDISKISGQAIEYPHAVDWNNFQFRILNARSLFSPQSLNNENEGEEVTLMSIPYQPNLFSYTVFKSALFELHKIKFNGSFTSLFNPGDVLITVEGNRMEVNSKLGSDFNTSVISVNQLDYTSPVVLLGDAATDDSGRKIDFDRIDIAVNSDVKRITADQFFTL